MSTEYAFGGQVRGETLRSYSERMDLGYLLDEWDTEKNLPRTPDSVCCGSKTKVWWRCGKGHEWESAVSVRAAGARCPYCSGRRPIVGETDLTATDPDLAAQWHPTKNGGLRPEQFGRGSHKKVWWRCERGHEWEACIYARAGGIDCPVCSGRLVVPGVNDLATVFPELAAEWVEDNLPLAPEKVRPYSNKKVWWRCGKGHKWQTTVNARVSQASGCPYCTNRKVLPGFNDLATTEPQIAAQWHPTLNGDLTPDRVLPGADKNAWWICSRGHVWRAVISSRGKRKTGCPLCAGNVSKKWRARYERELAELLPPK